jgi:hypothetical protein
MDTITYSIPASVRLHDHVIPVVVRADWLPHDRSLLEPGDPLGEIDIRAVVTVAHRDVQDELDDAQWDALCELAQSAIEGGLAPDAPGRPPSAPDVLQRAGLIFDLPVREHDGRVLIDIAAMLRLNAIPDTPAIRARMRAVVEAVAAACYPGRELMMQP